MLVKDLMHTAVLTIAPDAGLDRALVIMNAKRIRHLPVVENNKMVGLISNRDLHLSMVEQTGPQNAPKGMYLPALTKIRAVMKKDVLTLKPENTVFEAARLMSDKKIGCLPVINADGSLAGILTETDLLQLLVKLIQEKEA